MTGMERLARVEACLETGNQRLDRILAILEGAEGVVVRLDRVEQSHKRLRHYSHALTGAVIAALSTKLLPALAKLWN